ncbi:N(6)-adenine-specific DNA methyltransferase 2 [Phytophthora megakarya]|uniref:N(6)-adenine-specific DNA methyltransferase 2 n=1 Tax=Phytophthora megakarya TaxID=4795 RepID=A0A225WK73_9STRA|nr:N(6)-adenine-specific DNA methyltransferase 2 [Phytophthora megakarya]
MEPATKKTIAALQAHLLNRLQKEDAPRSEALRFSQLYVAIQTIPKYCHMSHHGPMDLYHGSWYDEKIGRALAQEGIDHSSGEPKIAFVSISTA